MNIPEKFDIIEKSARERYIPVIVGDSKQELLAVVATLQPKKILEIGTAIGYSGSLMLLHCDGILDTVELDENRASEARENFAEFGLTERVSQYIGDAKEILPTLADNRYDLVFIDGPKSKYPDHYRYAMQVLNVGGVIFADNVHFRGLVTAAEYPERRHRSIVLKLREFIDIITHDERVQTTIKDTGDGIAIIKRIK